MNKYIYPWFLSFISGLIGFFMVSFIITITGFKEASFMITFGTNFPKLNIEKINTTNLNFLKR